MDKKYVSDSLDELETVVVGLKDKTSDPNFFMSYMTFQQQVAALNFYLATHQA